VTAPGTAEALQRGRAVDAAEPDAIVASPASYFHHRDDEVVAHYVALADLGRPVVVYNSPKYSTPLTIASATEVLGLPHVVGIKDSSSDPALLRELIKIAADTSEPGGRTVGVGQGNETQALAALYDGADGIVPGVANLAPAAAQRLIAAFRAGDDETAATAQALLTRLTGIHAVRPGVPTVKAILADRGLTGTALMPPLISCTDAERAALRDLLAPDADQLVGLDRS
jgi:4-hydroxy-tetrahydrodipicolinate synthase